jgi:Uma2 family endonuclease
MTLAALYQVDLYEPTQVPRAAIELPLPLPVPPGFDPERLETWPKVHGRLEYFDGELWFMPPCGDDQQDTAADVVTELGLWRRDHPEFLVGANASRAAPRSCGSWCPPHARSS